MIELPAHWETLRLKTCASNIVEQVPVGGFGGRGLALESVESWTGRIRDTASLEGVVKRFQRGDVLFGKLRPYLAKVARPEEDGVCVGEFLVLRPRGGWFDSTFMAHLMRSKPIIEAVNASTFGARMPRAEWDFIGAMRVPVPSRAEQKAIVRFLDHADRRIQRAIRAKQKLIALLNEQTQAVVQHAITRGLDPNARLKPSGVDCLGEVPEHWEVKRLKTICRMKSGDGITAERIEAAGTYPVYGGNGLRGYSEDFTHSGEYVLIGRQGALCGNVHVATGKFWASEHAVVASLDARHSVPWFAALLTVMDLNQYSVAAAQPGLAVERILNLGVTVPPPEEQRMIADGIARRTAPLERAARTAEREVSLLREYRTRLIADVVTGKLDVRGAAAGLPVEVGEPEPLDEIDVEQTDESEADDLEAAEA